MANLIMDRSSEIQQMAYQFLQSAAKKRTEYLVIEAGVDAEANFNAEIPLELIDVLRRGVDPEVLDGSVSATTLCSTLSLMILLECIWHFVGLDALV